MTILVFLGSLLGALIVQACALGLYSSRKTRFGPPCTSSTVPSGLRPAGNPSQT